MTRSGRLGRSGLGLAALLALAACGAPDAPAGTQAAANPPAGVSAGIVGNPLAVAGAALVAIAAEEMFGPSHPAPAAPASAD